MHVIAPGLRFLSILLFFLLPWIALFNRCSLYQAHTSSHSRAAHFINTTQPRYIALCPTERRASFREGGVILTLRVVAVVWDKLFATSKWNMSQLHNSLASQSPCFSASADSNPTEHIVWKHFLFSQIPKPSGEFFCLLLLQMAGWLVRKLSWEKASDST